ncbi:DotU family type IV/VI secretion system protein [Pollutimonas harenae]|uniref:DotU family type IV/VI secretion system protein n=1 Tax=Pollutimonas harenae TaxID=657015 RepID=A0A853H0B2_9BURK|nr:DotU family type IV/VI secretion system protein [Pollutimonas harenae]NYT85139.1 DotU family type IV/VI secretion system protein [Pollutimonas harenae]TEA72479.1 DotU family type IV/VI secretion system protein [Pollutimonas harenae]
MRLASYWIPRMELAYAAIRQSDTNVEGIVAQLKESLDQAGAQARRAGHSSESVQNALYATVAWIDELAMSVAWPGSAAWRLSPLQRHYFATTRAGVGFFDRLQDLPEQATDVREVFALMLIAGFQGQFAHRPAAELEQFRNALLERVAQESNMAPVGGGQPLFPEAYALGKQVAMSRRPVGPSTAAILMVVLPLLVLVGLYVYLNTQLFYDTAELVKPLTKGL